MAENQLVEFWYISNIFPLTLPNFIDILLQPHSKSECGSFFSLTLLKYNAMNENFQMAVVPQSFLNEIQSDIRELKETLKSKEKEEISRKWLDSNEARKMLGVSQKTWQTYRDERVIPFSQIGRKIYVRYADIEKYLESHNIKKEGGRNGK